MGEEPYDPTAWYLVEPVEGGVMLTCTLCGVHNWQEGSQPLADLLHEAAIHRRICKPGPDPDDPTSNYPYGWDPPRPK